MITKGVSDYMWGWYAMHCRGWIVHGSLVAHRPPGLSGASGKFDRPVHGIIASTIFSGKIDETNKIIQSLRLQQFSVDSNKNVSQTVKAVDGCNRRTSKK